MKKITDENKPALALFALRNLKIGEELRYDYGLLDLPWRKNKGNLNWPTGHQRSPLDYS
jgi:hypothetical protein